MAQRAEVAVFPWTTFQDVEQVLARCLDALGGMQAFVKPGQSVVIKPNLTADAPSASGGTTHVELTEAVVKAVKDCAPGSVIVAEATGRFGIKHETAFPTGGWREMAERQGVELFNLDHGPHREIKIEGGHYPNTIPFSELLLETDVFITVPCLKTHLADDYTVSLKNSYALTPQWKRSEIHRDYMLEQALADINRIRKPDLTVVDAWDGAEGIAGGTDFKRPAGARLMIVGGDPVAVDVVSVEIIQSPKPTRYLTWCIEDGLGEGDLDAITVFGPGLEACGHPFMTAADEIMIQMPGVQIHDQGACSGCRVAATSALKRFSDQKQLLPLGLVFGGEGELVSDDRTLIMVGNCAKRWADRATFVPGCPASTPQVVEALLATGAICEKCRHLAEDLLSELPERLRPYLRMVAAGNQVFVGDRVERGAWHLELLVGECMRRYAEAVMERAASFGMDVERDLVWLQGCPPDMGELHAAVQKLDAVLDTQRLAVQDAD